MPKKPTAHAAAAERALRALLREATADRPLPPVRALAARFSVHASTVCRMLRDLADEGVAWRNPGGRYFAAEARADGQRGRSLCFVGREMSHWNRLYQEVLSGLSEVCTANGGNLVLIGAPALVTQAAPHETARFATRSRQAAELLRIIPRIPRGCGGIVADHLWDSAVLGSAGWPKTELRTVLLPPPAPLGAAWPHHARGAALATEHARACGYPGMVVARPFRGDPAIDLTAETLLAAWGPGGRAEDAGTPADLGRLVDHLLRGREPVCVMGVEDNTTLVLEEILRQRGTGPARIGLIAVQGTGAVGAPLTRIRYDFRRIGRATASVILHGRRPWTAPATLLPGRTTAPVR